MLIKNKFSLFLTLIITALITYIIFLHYSKPKTGYVYIREVYEGFEMKKEIEKKYLKTKTARDKILDSLKFELTAILKKIDSQKQKDSVTIKLFETKREEFIQKKNSFEEDNTALTKEYDQQILTQLNQYIKDYGTDNNFSLLFGNDGNGSLMYGSEELNRTKEVLKFINEKYKGVN